MTDLTPNIKEITLSLASAHGIFNRFTPEAVILDAASAALEADGVYTLDVRALEVWLGTLTEDQKMTLVAGEEEEMSALVACSPSSVLSGTCVGQLIEDIYEALEAMQ